MLHLFWWKTFSVFLIWYGGNRKSTENKPDRANNVFCFSRANKFSRTSHTQQTTTFTTSQKTLNCNFSFLALFLSLHRLTVD